MRKIIHIDMDCFYAAIEVRDQPSLRGRPVAVGGRPEQRGVLCTCNYEARRYGLHAAMASAQALRRCPGLVLLPVRMDKYKRVSRQIQAIFHQFTDRVEPLSLDEAYLDVTDSAHCQGSATRIAAAIRRRIFEQQGLTASAGVAPNKFLAKVASDWRKPNGQFVIPPGAVAGFVRQLPVAKVYGVGKVTAAKLAGLGVQTCGDLQAWPLAELQRQFGSFGETLYRLCRGQDERPVQTRRLRKSLSVEETFSRDLAGLAACRDQFPALLAEFERRLARLGNRDAYRIKTQFVKIKFNDFTQTTIQGPYQGLALEHFLRLFEQRYRQNPRPVRLLGLGVQFLQPDPADQAPQQLSLPL